MSIIIDTIQALGDLLMAGIRLILSIVSNVLLSGIDLAISFVNNLVNLVFSSAGYLYAISRILPTHFYTFATILISCIIVRGILKKILG